MACGPSCGSTPIADLIRRIHRTCFHVVLKAKRMAHFMRNDIFKQTPHQIVGAGEASVREDRAGQPVRNTSRAPGSSHCCRTECRRLESRRCADLKCAVRWHSSTVEGSHAITECRISSGAQVGSSFAVGAGLPIIAFLNPAALEGFIPILDSFLEPRHPFLGSRGIDVINNRFHRL